MDQGSLTRGQADNSDLVLFPIKSGFGQDGPLAFEDEGLGQTEVGEESQFLKIVGKEE